MTIITNQTHSRWLSVSIRIRVTGRAAGQRVDKHLINIEAHTLWRSPAPFDSCRDFGNGLACVGVLAKCTTRLQHAVEGLALAALAPALALLRPQQAASSIPHLARAVQPLSSYVWCHSCAPHSARRNATHSTCNLDIVDSR
jgi:hypothetical protein